MNPVINRYGTKTWYNKKGRLHRTDGPACEYAGGSKSWWLNGHLHRTDGPACEWTDGYSEASKEWYLNGTQLSEVLFLKLTGPVKKLPLYLGLGFDVFISERLKNESDH
jgi:hypothetical protein